jgi:hypothetical protein
VRTRRAAIASASRCKIGPASHARIRRKSSRMRESGRIGTAEVSEVSYVHPGRESPLARRATWPAAVLGPPRHSTRTWPPQVTPVQAHARAGDWHAVVAAGGIA